MSHYGKVWFCLSQQTSRDLYLAILVLRNTPYDKDMNSFIDYGSSITVG